jgi:hypothetical protein
MCPSLVSLAAAVPLLISYLSNSLSLLYAFKPEPTPLVLSYTFRLCFPKHPRSSIVSLRQQRKFPSRLLKEHTGTQA